MKNKELLKKKWFLGIKAFNNFFHSKLEPHTFETITTEIFFPFIKIGIFYETCSNYCFCDKNKIQLTKTK